MNVQMMFVPNVIVKTKENKMYIHLFLLLTVVLGAAVLLMQYDPSEVYWNEVGPKWQIILNSGE